MISNELSRNVLMDNIQLKLKSLITVLSELKQSSNEFDLSICNDINAYIQIVQTDCQRIINNNKNQPIENINDNKNIPKSKRLVINNDNHNEKLQKFEDEIDFNVDKVIKSMQITGNILNTNHKKKSLLEEQINDIYQKLKPHTNTLNNEIDNFNNTDVKMRKEFCEWKTRLKQKNDMNVLLTHEAHALVHRYQQNMLMVMNNIMNIVRSASKSLSLRADCLKLEIRILWEGDIILKMYRNVDKLIDVNSQKLDCYNDLQSEMGKVNYEIKYLDTNVICTNSKMKNCTFNQIQKHNIIKNIVEEKFRCMCELNDKFPVIEQLLANSREHLNNIENNIKKNQAEIYIKHQQIADESTKINQLKNNFNNKYKFLLDTKNVIENKQSELKEIELKNENMSQEIENKRLELRKKQYDLQIMKRISEHQQKEMKEKVQFYQEAIIEPLEFKLEKSIALVEYENMRNNKLKTCVIELSPGFKKAISNAKSQIKQLDKSIKLQYGIMTNVEKDLKNIELDILSQLDIATNNNEKYINTFQTIMDYRIKMASNVEIKEKSATLECLLFQKRYNMQKKKENWEKEENLLTTQLNELKQSVREQVVLNSNLSRQYIRLRK